MSISIQSIYGMKLGIELASAEDKEFFEINGGFVISLLLVDIVFSW